MTEARTAGDVAREVVAANPDGDTTTLARELAETLEGLAANGERWAEAALRRYTLTGAREDVRKAAKTQQEDLSLIVPNRAGVVRASIPARYATRGRDEETGAKTKAQQMPLWVHLPFAEALAIAASLIGQGDVLHFRGEVIGSAVVQAQARCPGATSIKDACDRLGITLQDLGIPVDMPLTGTEG